MNLSNKIIGMGLLACSSLLTPLQAAVVTNWTGNASVDTFSNAGNWDNGVPTSGVDGLIGSARVEVTALAQLQVGANVTFSGNSVLERTSSAEARFSGTFNINDTTDVKISYWSILENNTTLNWNSSGTFSTASAGTNGSNPHFALKNATSSVNISDGLWDLRGNGHATDSIQVDNGTFSISGGQIITDKRFKVGTGSTTGVVNYAAGAELRVQSMGLISPVSEHSVFNMEGGSTLYIQSGTEGENGTDGLSYWLNMLKAGVNSPIYIDDAQQSIGVDDTIVQSNFTTSTVQLDGIWYNGITAVPEPSAYAVFLSIAALIFLRLRQKKNN